MAKTLEAHDKLIREIFEGSYQFEIPDYQRPYAWTTEQVEELFDDLVSAIQDARTSGTASQYFLGSIVLIKNDREPKSSVHVRKNPAASNYDFAAKKNVYFKGKGTTSPFILTQEVRSEGAWTPAMLNDRQKRLVGVLERHWELEVPPTESVSKAPDTTTASQGQA